MSALDVLLDLQDRDLALDRLRHRLAVLPERAEVEASEARRALLQDSVTELRARRDGVSREEKRFEDEATGLGQQAADAEAKLYSGEIASPRELQALQADIAQLQRHQRSVEDRQLATMEQREPLDEELAARDGELTVLDGELVAQREALAAAEGTLEAELAAEDAARAEVARGIEADLLDAYEGCRDKANGVGAARLVGMTCQGCHLSIPATEAERIRKAADGVIEHCDNCGTILVP